MSLLWPRDYLSAFEEFECSADVGNPVNPLQLPALFTWLMTDNRKLADLSLRVKEVQVSTLLIYNIKLSFCLFCQPCSAAD